MTSKKFQTDEETWGSVPPKTVGGCSFSDELLSLHNEIGYLVEEIIPDSVSNVSLTDFIGLLGYSNKFDVTSLQENGYLDVTRPLLPLYEFDRAVDFDPKTKTKMVCTSKFNS